jgi:heme exporter protein B
MSSNWRREIFAILRKEVSTELRTKSGVLTSALFSSVAVVSVAFASFGLRLGGQLAAGLLWVTLLFAAVVALPRAFLAEEEQGTGDLLRLVARPHAVFWGKVLYNLLQMLSTSLLLSLLFFLLTDVSVPRPWLYLACMAAGSASLAGAVTLCGALVSQAASRSALAGAIALPLLLPLIALLVTGTGAALGAGSSASGVTAALGLAGYGATVLALGPYLFAAVWKS